MSLSHAQRDDVAARGPISGVAAHLQQILPRRDLAAYGTAARPQSRVRARVAIPHRDARYDASGNVEHLNLHVCRCG